MARGLHALSFEGVDLGDEPCQPNYRTRSAVAGATRLSIPNDLGMILSGDVRRLKWVGDPTLRQPEYAVTPLPVDLAAHPVFDLLKADLGRGSQGLGAPRHDHRSRCVPLAAGARGLAGAVLEAVGRLVPALMMPWIGARVHGCRTLVLQMLAQEVLRSSESRIIADRHPSKLPAPGRAPDGEVLAGAASDFAAAPEFRRRLPR